MGDDSSPKGNNTDERFLKKVHEAVQSEAAPEVPVTERLSDPGDSSSARYAWLDTTARSRSSTRTR